MAKMASKGLLETLAKELGCAYLSDLKDPALTGQIAKALAELDPDDFTIEQWRDTTLYLTGEKADPKDPAQNKQALITCLEKNSEHNK